MKTISAFSLVFFLTIALSVNGAVAQDKNDSQQKSQVRNKIKCKKGDARYIYWAAGKHVFKFPRDSEQQTVKQVEDKTARNWFEANQDIPEPNDADEPEGCLQNPLRAGDFPQIYQFEQKKFQEIFGRKIDYRTGLAWTGVYAISASRSMSVSNERHKKKHRENFFHCTAISSEMIDCKFPDVQDKSDFKKARIFIVRPSKIVGLSVPEDIYISVQGWGDRLSVRMDYSLLEAIRVDRSFRIAPNEIEKIPQFNQSLVDYIIGSRVENYVWKNSKSTTK